MKSYYIKSSRNDFNDNLVFRNIESGIDFVLAAQVQYFARSINKRNK